MSETSNPKHTSDPHDFIGQWIAVLNDEVVGSGPTRELAVKSAYTSRADERPHIRLVPPSDDESLFAILDLIRPAFPANIAMYVVGGAVRDHLLKRPIQDLDFVLPANGIIIARKVANYLGGEFYALDDERGTGRVLLFRPDGRRLILDFAAQRGEDLEEDLRGRDFTANALAIDAHDPQNVHDPLGGAMDIHQLRVRTCSENAFVDDPLRVLRAVRMATGFGFQISPETRTLLREAAPNLKNISAERLRDEVLKILGGPKPAAAVRVIEILGLLPHVFPELLALKGLKQDPPHVHDTWEHTLSVLGHLDNLLRHLGSLAHDPEAAGNLATGLAVMMLGRYREKIHAHLAETPVPERNWRGMLMLAALYHDAGKPEARSLDENGRIRFLKHEVISARLIDARTSAFKLSKTEINRLNLIVRHHMRPHFLVAAEGAPTRRAIYRFFRDTQIAGVDICLLNMADVLATYERTLLPELWKEYLDLIRELLENWWEHPAETVLPPALLNGRDLLTRFQLTPGPIIGEYLEQVREAQASGEITTKEEAFQLIEKALNK